MTEHAYKAEIEEAVGAHSNRFEVPEEGAREYLLQNRCKADFCFHIKPQGQLFIEDDDSARGLNNLIKYWIWCEDHPDVGPVHLIHILDTTRPAQVTNIKFLARKMENGIPAINFHIVKTPNWEVPTEQWLPDLRKILAGL